MVYCYLIFKHRAWRDRFECDAFNLICPWVNAALLCGPSISFLGSFSCYVYNGVQQICEHKVFVGESGDI